MIYLVLYLFFIHQFREYLLTPHYISKVISEPIFFHLFSSSSSSTFQLLLTILTILTFTQLVIIIVCSALSWLHKLKINKHIYNIIVMHISFSTDLSEVIGSTEKIMLIYVT